VRTAVAECSPASKRKGRPTRWWQRSQDAVSQPVPMAAFGLATFAGGV
jgi:hypothetical protein